MEIYSIQSILSILTFRKESSIIRFTLILYYVLTNLQLALKFVCPFIIREGASCTNKVENLFVVIMVINVTSNPSFRT